MKEKKEVLSPLLWLCTSSLHEFLSNSIQDWKCRSKWWFFFSCKLKREKNEQNPWWKTKTDRRAKEECLKMLAVKWDFFPPDFFSFCFLKTVCELRQIVILYYIYIYMKLDLWDVHPITLLNKDRQYWAKSNEVFYKDWTGLDDEDGRQSLLTGFW